MRIGFGYDVHKLVTERKLILGGVEIPHETGLLGHSDADVLIHALMDAMLGALSLGDIGKHFPDTDGSYKNINSMLLLEKVTAMMKQEGYCVGNIDCTICAQRPKLATHIDTMRENIARTLHTDIQNVSIKATTTEGLGFPGREEGICAYAVCLLKKENQL